MVVGEIGIATDIAEIKGDIKLLLLRLDTISAIQKDHETRIRNTEVECTTSRIKIGLIVTVAGLLGGATTTVLGILIEHAFG